MSPLLLYKLYQQIWSNNNLIYKSDEDKEDEPDHYRAIQRSGTTAIEGKTAS